MGVRLWIHVFMATGLITGSIAYAQGDTVSVRTSTHVEVWSTSPDPFRRFVQQGSIEDRGLG